MRLLTSLIFVALLIFTLQFHVGFAVFYIVCNFYSSYIIFFLVLAFIAYRLGYDCIFRCFFYECCRAFNKMLAIRCDQHYLEKLASWSNGNAFVSEAGGLSFKSRAGQIEHSVANGSSPLRHFERSCVARAQ